MSTQEEPQLNLALDQSASKTRMFTPQSLFPEERRRQVNPDILRAISYRVTQGRSAMDATDDLVLAGEYGVEPSHLGVVNGV